MSKILNDPIHGTIELDPLLIKIIDTPQFQRLRNIKQLGGCYFVYPSASHNRFEHSIGTCFLASKLARRLQKQLKKDVNKLGTDGENEKKTKLEKAEMSKNDKLCIEIAALCHDIGHGPYSHLFDRLFNKAMKKKDPSTVEWKHEDVSRMMIDYMIEENGDLKAAFKLEFVEETERCTEFIKNLIDGNKKKSEDKAKYYMYEIVANKRNEIDVDKMDYFARDCHGLGMNSNFDHLRYISQCRVMFSSDKPDETTIAVRDKEEHNLYELFHTRIGLFRRAYYHKVTKAVELMFTDALVNANDHFLFQNHKGEDVKMSEAWKYPEVYVKLTDNVFDGILMEKNPKKDMKKAQELINNVYKRKLYKRVYETPPVKTVQEKGKDLENLLLQTELTEDDFAVQKSVESKFKATEIEQFARTKRKVTYSYGKGTDNPITSVYFYTKDNDTDCFPSTMSKKTSLFLPETFQEEILRVYSKNDDKIDILKKETTECLRQIEVYSVNDSATKQEHWEIASAETGNKQ